MAEIMSLEELEAGIIAPKHVSLKELKEQAPDIMSVEDLTEDLVQIGSLPTPEPKPTIEGEPPAFMSLKDLEAQAPQVGVYGRSTPFPSIRDEDPERDMKWYSNFFNSLYASTVPAFSSAMASLKGDIDKAKFIQQEAQKTYDIHSKSAYAGAIAGSVLTTAAALGGAAIAGAGSVVGGLILVTYFGYHALMGAGQAKGLLLEYEEKAGKDFSILTETAVTIAGGLIVLIAEKTGAKWLMKSGLLKRETLAQIGKAWVKKDTATVRRLLMENIPKSMFKGGLVEGGEEAFEQVMGNFIQATYNPEVRDFEDLTAGVIESAIAGGLAGAILGGGITAIQIGSKKTMTAMGHDLLNVEEVERVTASLKEIMPADSEGTISRALGYISARAKMKDIPLHEFTEEYVTDSNQLKEGSQLITDALESPNIHTLFEGIGSIIREDLSPIELESAEKLFNVKDGEWTEAKNKKFVDMFMKWLTTGKTRNKQLEVLFRKTQEGLVNFYEGATLAKTDYIVSKEMGEFFDSLFMKENDILYTDPVGLDKKSNILAVWGKKMYDGFLDKVNIESRTQRMGWEHVGLHAKKRASVESHYQKEGQMVMANMFDSFLAKGFKPKTVRTGINKLIFLYEDKSKWEALTKDERAVLQDTYDILDNYWKGSLEEYKEKGILNMGFVERLTSTLEEQLLTLEGKKKTDKVKKSIREVKESLEKVEKLQYIHIPLSAWREHIVTHDPSKGRDLIKLMAQRKRETIFIADIVDTVNEDGTINEKGFGLKESDVRMGDILASFATRKGRDFANINLRDAAIKDRQVKVREVNKDETFSKVIPEGFRLPATNLAFLKGYVVTKHFASFMSDMTRRIDNIGLPSKVLNIAKMTAFWNPLFLPMYDTIQAAMLGSLSPLRPLKSIDYIRRAWKTTSVYGRIHQLAEKGGAFSTPFPNHLTNEIEMVNAMAAKGILGGKTVLGRQYKAILGDLLSSYLNPIQHLAQFKFGALKQDIGVLIKNAFGLKQIYNLSWKTAWTLDNTIRVASTIYLNEKHNMSWDDAAQKAALFHGDYAGVPTSTRRQLNRLLFTPTFKIAMAKLYIEMLSGFGNSLHPTVKTNKEFQFNKMAVMRLMAIVGGFDMLMLSLGYDRDEWGRRYTRRVITEEGLPKESVVTWSGPHNMFLKYLYRAQDAMGPTVDSRMKKFFKANKWELHPLYRVTLEVINNKDVSGDPIVSAFDSSIARGQAPIKEVKQVAYLLRNVVTILKVIGDEFEDPKARALLQRELRQSLGMILGTTITVASKPFTFTYIRDIESVRAAQGLQTLSIYLSRDLNKIIEATGTLEKDDYEFMIEEYLSRVNEVLLEADLMDYDLDPEPR